MGLLTEAVKRLREPLVEGRGIKVFRLEEDVHDWWGSNMEATNPEMLRDMLEQPEVRQMVEDMKRALDQGQPMEEVLDKIEDYEADADVDLSDEERNMLRRAFEDGSIDTFMNRAGNVHESVGYMMNGRPLGTEVKQPGGTSAVMMDVSKQQFGDLEPNPIRGDDGSLYHTPTEWLKAMEDAGVRVVWNQFQANLSVPKGQRMAGMWSHQQWEGEPHPSRPSWRSKVV